MKRDSGKKSEFIETIEGYSFGVIVGIIIFSVIILGGAYFGVVFPRAVLMYLLMFTVGPWLFVISIVIYIIVKLIGWLQEGKSDYAIFSLIGVIAAIFLLQATGTMSQSISILKECTYTPNELWSDNSERIHKCPINFFDQKTSCDSDSILCNDQCYTKCENNLIFVCDPIEGGTCQYDVAKCEEQGKHSCKGTCWDSCPAGTFFICDDVNGGICKQY